MTSGVPDQFPRQVPSVPYFFIPKRSFQALSLNPTLTAPSAVTSTGRFTSAGCGYRDSTQRLIDARERTPNAGAGVGEERAPAIERVFCIAYTRPVNDKKSMGTG